MSKRKKEKYVAVLAVCTKQVFIFFFFFSYCLEHYVCNFQKYL